MRACDMSHMLITINQMSYSDFLSNHPELQDSDPVTKRLAYQDYLDNLDEAFQMMEEE